MRSVTVALLPDPALGAKVEGEEKAKLGAKRASMSDTDVRGFRVKGLGLP